MANATNIALRWALAYLLIINSIDTLGGQTPTGNPINDSVWASSLIWMAALVNLAGSALLLLPWKLAQTAMVLAVSTGIFATFFQEPIAIALTFALLVVALNNKKAPLNRQADEITSTQKDAMVMQNKVSSDVESADGRHGLAC